MNLKEAFRFQNRLQDLIIEAERILETDANITTTESITLRRKVFADAEDIHSTLPAPSEYGEHITDLVRFVAYLLDERASLFSAIRKAKASLDIDIDSETSLNSSRQELARILRHMSDLKSSETLTPNGAIAYRFNAEGNETPYRCDLKKITKINYDRNIIKKQMSRLSKTADEISTKIDVSLVTSVVDYKAPFDVNASFGEIFEGFIAL